MRNIKTILGLILAIGFVACPSVCEAAKSPKVQMFGPTGIYGTLDKNTIKVTKVDGPAKDKIKPGMVIIGAGGANFKEHVRRELADAIDIAETKAAGGKLTLILKGGNKLDLTLEVLGTYSDTAPYDCPKSAKILERAKIGGGILTFSQLANMAKKDAVATVAPQQAPEIGKLVVSRDELKPNPSGYYVWRAGYQLIAQCEGYLINPNPSAFKSIRTTALNFAAGQDGVGLWGHKLVVPETGRLRGYGQMNQPSLTAFIGMLMAKKCGVKDPLLHDSIERSYAYFATYIGRGGFKYGVHGPDDKNFNNNGMSGSAAIAMALYGDQKGARFFAQLAAASYDRLEQGHAAHFFNPFWTPLGVAVGGPELASEFFKKARWLYTMMRRWDGKFEYIGKDHKFDGSSLVIPYTLPKRSLLITGRDADESIWLRGKAAKDAVEMARTDYKAKTTDALLALLDHQIPHVRRAAGWNLRDREKDLLPRIRTLMKEGSKREKIFALGYFGYPKPPEAGLPYLDDMGAVLKDAKADPWVRSAAAGALSQMGKPAKNYYMDIVRMIAEERPSDGLGDIDNGLVRIVSGMSGTPFADGLVTDKQAQYKAAVKMMKHPLHQPRGFGARMLVGMPLEDFDKVADALLHVIEDKDPSHATYGPGPAGGAVTVLASLNIREGLEYTRKIENTPNAKAGGIFRTIWPIWSAYGGNAKGELERFRKKHNNRTNWGRLGGIYNPMVKAVEEDENPPKLISLEEARRAGTPRKK